MTSTPTTNRTAVRTSARLRRTILAAGLGAAALGTGGAAMASSVPPDSAGTDGAPAPSYEIPGGTASEEYCQGVVGAQMAFATVPEDPAAVAAYADEYIHPNLELVETNAPADLADAVTTVTSTVRTVLESGDFAAFDTPEYRAAEGAVFSTLDETCGFPIVETLARDFSYGGIPAELPAGVTVFALTNDSESGEGHELGLVKLLPEVDISVEDLLAAPEEEQGQYIDTFAGGAFAPAGETAYLLTVLTPGRWGYACFVPVGSIGETIGSGPPHFMEGMYGEFSVA